MNNYPKPLRNEIPLTFAKCAKSQTQIQKTKDKVVLCLEGVFNKANQWNLSDKKVKSIQGIFWHHQNSLYINFVKKGQFLNEGFLFAQMVINSSLPTKKSPTSLLTVDWLYYLPDKQFLASFI